MFKSSLFTGLFCLILLIACNTPEEKTAKITKQSFGTTPDGTEVESYTMTNTAGMNIEIITYGGVITSLTAPDKVGNYEDVVLGYDNLEDYLDVSPFFGAIIGRYGNRIADGKFTLDSVEYTLATNNGKNHLHGGNKGFDKVVWSAEPVKVDDGVALALTYTSSDMEEGYPGTLDVKVLYTLGNDNSLTFDYTATTDKKTVVNLTQHSYFNLSSMNSDILGQKLSLNAPTFLPVDSTLIPTGELRSVAHTPFDFTKSKLIGAEINAENEQITFGGGFDHCWVLAESQEVMPLAATLSDPASGRVMEVYTTEPAIQFYSGNFLDGTITGKNEVTYGHRSGLCLETQHYPDSPNQPEFPSVILEPGQKYKTSTKYVFSIK
ncbi:MAG: aldose epimerase family protein [Cyclobacteriaceae bacterium]